MIHCHTAVVGSVALLFVSVFVCNDHFPCNSRSALTIIFLAVVGLLFFTVFHSVSFPPSFFFSFLYAFLPVTLPACLPACLPASLFRLPSFLSIWFYISISIYLSFLNFHVHSSFHSFFCPRPFCGFLFLSLYVLFYEGCTCLCVLAKFVSLYTH